MPYDPGFEDEDPKRGGSEDRDRRFSDFDCPECSANNPYDESFGDGDEIRCYYCGQEFKVEVSDGGRLRLRAV